MDFRREESFRFLLFSIFSEDSNLFIFIFLIPLFLGLWRLIPADRRIDGYIYNLYQNMTGVGRVDSAKVTKVNGKTKFNGGNAFQSYSFFCGPAGLRLFAHWRALLQKLKTCLYFPFHPTGKVWGDGSPVTPPVLFPYPGTAVATTLSHLTTSATPTAAWVYQNTPLMIPLDF